MSNLNSNFFISNFPSLCSCHISYHLRFVHVCTCAYACLCLLRFSISIFISQNPSTQVKFNSCTTYPTSPLTHPVSLPGFPASCFAHPTKNPGMLKLQCAEEDCGKVFPPSNSVFALFCFFSPLHSATVSDVFGLV